MKKRNTDLLPRTIEELEEAMGITNPFAKGSDCWFEQELVNSYKMSFHGQSPKEISDFLEFLKKERPSDYPRIRQKVQKSPTDKITR